MPSPFNLDIRVNLNKAMADALLLGYQDEADEKPVKTGREVMAWLDTRLGPLEFRVGHRQLLRTIYGHGRWQVRRQDTAQ